MIWGPECLTVLCKSLEPSPISLYFPRKMQNKSSDLLRDIQRYMEIQYIKNIVYKKYTVFVYKKKYFSNSNQLDITAFIRRSMNSLSQFACPFLK